MRLASPRVASLLCVALLGVVCNGRSFGQAKPQPHAASHFEITGVLVSSADGSPVTHGHLFPTLAGRGRNAGRHFPASLGDFEADERGRFSIPLPSAGAWNVAASARGFTRQSYEAHEQFSTAVVLSQETPAMEIRFVLSPEAEITGVVVDEAGEAVRRAQVSLMTVHPAEPDRAAAAATTRAVTQTDDRGIYEFAGLPPGSYRVGVAAQPWYAVASGPGRISSTEAPVDPALDVTYPMTWFPGVDDPELAESLTVNAGDMRQADFHLLPIPSVHLLIDPPPGENAMRSGRPIPGIPIFQRIDSGGALQPFVSVTFRMNARGQLDIGGLSPGTYRVRTGGPGQAGRSSVVKMAVGSVQTLDLNAPSNEARVSVQVDGLPESEAGSVQVSLIDPATRQSVTPSFGGGRLRDFRLQRGGPAGDRTLEVPPGTYEVVLQGSTGVYLTGVSAKGAAATGRMVTVPSGDSSLTVHVSSGRATLTGIASIGDKPSIGAMVLLVPTTLGEAGAISILRRDQTNTDGSFDLPEVIPGQYILVAIENGWQVNWNDASTLRRYLMQGVPLDLTSGGNVKQNVTAQAP